MQELIRAKLRKNQKLLSIGPDFVGRIYDEIATTLVEFDEGYDAPLHSETMVRKKGYLKGLRKALTILENLIKEYEKVNNLDTDD